MRLLLVLPMCCKKFVQRKPVLLVTTGRKLWRRRMRVYGILYYVMDSSVATVERVRWLW